MAGPPVERRGRRRAEARRPAVMTGWISRGLAVVIAIAGVIDPAVTTMRPVRPTVSILSANEGDAAHQALTARVERALGRRFAVARAFLPDTAAVVVSGSRLPD